MRLALVWAQTPAGVIGADGTLPWHLPEDLARFRNLTSGHAVLMGRRTWESLPERMRPLPGRRNVVLSRDPAYVADGAQVSPSLDAALAAVATEDEVWVIGGAALFDATIARADRLEVTDVDLAVPGDTHAPAIDLGAWRSVPSEAVPALEPAPGGAQQSTLDDGSWLRSRTGTRYRFRSYVRADAAGTPGTGAVA